MGYTGFPYKKTQKIFNGKRHWGRFFYIIKTEFVRSRRFENLEHLKVELMTYVY